MKYGRKLFLPEKLPFCEVGTKWDTKEKNQRILSKIHKKFIPGPENTGANWFPLTG